MRDINDDLRRKDRRGFARAVFRSIAWGRDEMPTKPWPSFRSWVPAPRDHLPECMEAPRRMKPLTVHHGPVVAGQIQPIRKRWDFLKNRLVTNEV